MGCDHFVPGCGLFLGTFSKLRTGVVGPESKKVANTKFELCLEEKNKYTLGRCYVSLVEWVEQE